MSVSLKADIGGSVGSIQLNGADRLLLNADGTLSGTVNPTTGLRTSALATMQKFADEFLFLNLPQGYQRLASGMLIQWGTFVQSASSNVLYSAPYPITFPGSVLIVVGGNRNTSGAVATAVNPVSNSGFNVMWGATGSMAVSWIAIGT